MHVSLLSSAGQSQGGAPACVPACLRTCAPFVGHGGATLLELPFASDGQARRAQQAEEERAEKSRLREARHDDLVAAASNSPRPSETLIEAERGMLPGSRALRQDQMQSQAREAAREQRPGFRQALADAARGRQTPTQTTSQRSAEAAGDAKQSSPGVPTNGEKPVAGENAPGAEARTAGTEPGRYKTAGTEPGRYGTAGQTPPRASLLAVTLPSSTEAGGGTATRPGSNVVRLTPVSVAGARAAGTAGASLRPAAGGAERPASQPVAAPEAVRVATTARKGAASSLPRGPTETGNSDANVERILRLIHTRIGKDRSVATLRLDPPELGKVRLRMELRHEQLALRIETQTAAAQRLLTEQLDTLRRSLEASGIQLERVEVRLPEVAQTGVQQHMWQPADARAGGGHGTAHSEAGEQPAHFSQPEAGISTEPTDGPAEAATGIGPAAESLVNVWA